MTSFTEQATLAVKDSSTSELNKINAALKKLFDTAKSLKSIKISIDVDFASVTKATQALKMLSAALDNAKKGGQIKVAAQGATAIARATNQAAGATRRIATSTRQAATASSQVAKNMAKVEKVPDAFAEARRLMRQLQAGADFPRNVFGRTGRAEAFHQIPPSVLSNTRQLIKTLSAVPKVPPSAIINTRNLVKSLQTPIPATVIRNTRRMVEEMQSAAAARAIPRGGGGIPLVPPRAPMPWGYPGAPPPRVPRGGGGGGMVPPGGGGGFMTGAGRFGRGLISGVTASGYGESLEHAIGRAIGRATRQGVNDSDIADTAVSLKQLPKAQETAIDQAAKAIVGEQVRTPSGALFNLAQTKRLLAEALPVAKGDIEGATTLVREMITMAKQEVGMGRSPEEARRGAIQYSKAVDQMGVMFDRQGKIIPGQAEKWFGVFRQVAPDIGEEMTGPFARQAVKYAGVARYGMDPRALAGLLFFGEEFGASSAGVKMREAVRSLSGLRITDAAAKNLSKMGLLSPEEAEAARKGRTGRRVADIVGGEEAEPALKQQNIFEWINRKLLPAYEADVRKRGKTMTGMDQGELQRDMAQFAARIGFASNAADLVAAALIRAPELKLQIDQALARRGDRAATEQALAGSTRIAMEGAQAQFQSMFGQLFTAAEPIILPATRFLSDQMKKTAEAIKGGEYGTAALELSKAAVPTAGAAALALPLVSALSPMLALRAAISEKPDVAAMGGAAAALTGAAASLTGAAGALTGAAVAQGAVPGLIGKLGPLLGPTVTTALRTAIPGLAAVLAVKELHDYTSSPEGQQFRSVEQATRAQRDALQNLNRLLEGYRSDLQTPGLHPEAKSAIQEKIAGLEERRKTLEQQLNTTTQRIIEEERKRQSAENAIEANKVLQDAKDDELEDTRARIRKAAEDAAEERRVRQRVEDFEAGRPRMEEPRPVPFPTPRPPGLGAAGEPIVVPPTLSEAADRLTGASTTFSTVFSTGASGITAAGETAGSSIATGGATASSTIQSGAAAAGAVLGDTAVARIQAGVSALSISVNAKVTSSTSGTDVGNQATSK